MIFIIECIAACALFTAVLEIMCAKRREIFTNDYPPVVTDKLRDLNIVGEKPPTKLISIPHPSGAEHPLLKSIYLIS